MATPKQSYTAEKSSKKSSSKECDDRNNIGSNLVEAIHIKQLQALRTLRMKKRGESIKFPTRKKKP